MAFLAVVRKGMVAVVCSVLPVVVGFFFLSLANAQTPMDPKGFCMYSVCTQVPPTWPPSIEIQW